MGAPKAARAEAEQHQNGRPARRLTTQSKTPPKARQALEALWELSFLSEEQRAALERFATYPSMLTEVWPKLPPDQDLIKSVIWSAIFALGVFPPRRPKRQSIAAFKRWAGFWLDDDRWSRPQNSKKFEVSDQATVEILWETCESIAIKLAYVIDATITDERWSRHWRGDPTMKDRVRAIRFLLAAADCFQSINADDHALEAKLPPVAGRKDRRSAEIFFCQYMSEKMEELCGDGEWDPMVSGLAAVAFDREDGPKPATVRGRRRMRAAKST